MLQSLSRQVVRVRATRLHASSIGEAGLAFLLAYVAAYFLSVP